MVSQLRYSSTFGLKFLQPDNYFAVKYLGYFRSYTTQSVSFRCVDNRGTCRVYFGRGELPAVEADVFPVVAGQLYPFKARLFGRWLCARNSWSRQVTFQASSSSLPHEYSVEWQPYSANLRSWRAIPEEYLVHAVRSWHHRWNSSAHSNACRAGGL